MNEDTESGLAPYARIVADIRSCIDTGELRPGDRVPSTREITRRWGVAMATATKALTVLRREGRVEAVRGVGTVVRRAPTTDPAPADPAGPVAETSEDGGSRGRSRTTTGAERRPHPEPHRNRLPREHYWLQHDMCDTNLVNSPAKGNVSLLDCNLTGTFHVSI